MKKAILWILVIAVLGCLAACQTNLSPPPKQNETSGVKKEDGSDMSSAVREIFTFDERREGSSDDTAMSLS